MLPELACIRLTAYDDSGRLIGHRVLPVVGLCPGYRHVALRTEGGQSLPLATLFLHIVVKVLICYILKTSYNTILGYANLILAYVNLM